MMFPHNTKEPREVLLARIKWLMSLRLVLATFSLGTATLIQITAGKAYLDSYLLYLYLIIGIVFTLSLLYAFIIRHAQRLEVFAFIQIMLDVLLISGLINVTGGVRSDFSLFYYLSIIAASIILYRRGGIAIASVSSVLYGSMIALDYYEVVRIPSPEPAAVQMHDMASLLFSILMNITSFYLVAFLSSFLSEQIRQSREALRMKENDYHRLETLHRNIIESISSGLVTIDKEKRITFFNRAGEVITGHAFSEVSGRNIEQVFPGLLQAAPVIRNGACEDANPRSRFEISFQRSDKKRIYLGFSKSVLKDSEGESQGEVYTFQDVTRLKEMEDQVKLVDRLAAVGRLATGMAHEIRNPLASMSGSIQVLGQSLKLDADNKRLMDIVLRETNRLDQLLSDFVLFTHPDDRKKKEIDLNTVVMDTVELFLSNPNHSSISVVTDLNGTIMLEADPHQLKQVLWNLFVNAHQAMSGGGELSVATRIITVNELQDGMQTALAGRHSRSWIQLTIADTGCGIEKAYLDKIFDPFFTTKPRGSGLGLAIVFSIVESYKGVISVKSQKDQGSTFTILLPSAHEQQRASG